MNKRRVTAFALATMLFTSTATGVEAASYTWKYQNNNWYYYTDNGKPVTGWSLYKNSWYYMGSDGLMKTGWVLDKNRWYFLDKSGVMKTGWLKEGNTWYFLDSSGAMKTGWLLNGGKWYFLTSSGAMKTGWLANGGKWYYLDQSGAMKTGWLKDQNTRYYLDPSGAMKTGWLWNNNNWYFLDQSGAMKTGWYEENNQKYYLEPSGEMAVGQKVIDGKTYVFTSSGALSTAPLSGWFHDGAKTVYYNADGTLYKGWLTEGNKKYYFGTDGIMVKGWLTDGKQKYYLGADGAAVTGWFKDQNSWYYFNNDGTAATGWVSDGWYWYFMNAEGIMQTGWVLDDGGWYYLSGSGAMQTGWVLDNGDWYYLSGSGLMQTGWLDWENNRYYLKATSPGQGKMLTGEQVIDGKTYIFFNNGILNTGKVFTKTTYNLTLQQMVDIQMKMSTPPQTDKYRNNNAYVNKADILLDSNDPTIGIVQPQDKKADVINVWEKPNAASHSYGYMNMYTKDSSGQQQPKTVKIVKTTGDWYEIEYSVAWRNAKPEDVQYYVNPNNFKSGSPEYFQFLQLSKNAGTDAKELNNKVLANKGILAGKAAAFIQASKEQNINEVYLISHALLETGNGQSALAKGIELTEIYGKKLDKPVTVYNMYGIGAYDSNPNQYGAEYAYNEKWFTPEAAIIGGAKFIAERYINNPVRKQDTLYKMRWDPAYNSTDYPGHWRRQYATDIGWAVKQVTNMKKIYDSLDSYTLYYDVPVYK